MAAEAREISVAGDDGHRWSLLARIPEAPTHALLWLPALGVAARHYLPFADALAAHGVATFVHEWRGHGSSSLRASRVIDWGYDTLLRGDLPASEAAVAAACGGVGTRVVGGHSLGGQLACCRLALAPASAQSLWLVATGAPYWRAFPWRVRWRLPPAYVLLATLASLRGALPGRAVGFGGNEARGLVHDWARSGLTGRYAARGLPIDLEQALRAVVAPTSSVVLARDWLAPESSLRHLLSKLGNGAARIERLTDATLGAPSDHFAWMKRPRAVASALAAAGRAA